MSYTGEPTQFITDPKKLARFPIELDLSGPDVPKLHKGDVIVVNRYMDGEQTSERLVIRTLLEDREWHTVSMTLLPVPSRWSWRWFKWQAFRAWRRCRVSD